MTVTPAFRAVRVVLVANILTPIYPAVTVQSVNIGNATTDDLAVHTTDTGMDYFIIPTTYERSISLQKGCWFKPDEIAFWLKATVSGTAVLIWL